MMNEAKTERDLVIELRDARQAKADAQEALSKANEAVERTEMALVELLESGDKKSTAKYEGIGFVIMNKPRVYASFNKENEPLVFEFLKIEGRADMIKQSVNAQTLSGFVKERLELGKGLPKMDRQGNIWSPDGELLLVQNQESGEFSKPTQEIAERLRANAKIDEGAEVFNYFLKPSLTLKKA